jgi:hypothetical protein
LFVKTAKNIVLPQILAVLLNVVSADNRDHKGTSNNSGNSGSSNVGDTISVTGVVEWTWERQGIDLGVGADNHRMGIQSKTNDEGHPAPKGGGRLVDQDRERLTKAPKGIQRK